MCGDAPPEITDVGRDKCGIATLTEKSGDGLIFNNRAGPEISNRNDFAFIPLFEWRHDALLVQILIQDNHAAWRT